MAALRILCAMLLVFLGFAHKPIAVSAEPLPASASYVLPDGSIASLCLPGHDGKPVTHVGAGCEACRLGSSIALPERCAEEQPVVGHATPVVFIAITQLLRRQVFPPNAPPRGPPSSMFVVQAA